MIRRVTVGLFPSRCPHCKSIDFRAVDPRSVIEKSLHWLLQPYRCGLCGHHFFLGRWQIPVDACR